MVSNGGYRCLPKGNSQTNCHLTIPSQIRTSHVTNSNNNNDKLYLNLYKAIECDKILQISDIQKNLYLNNGSFCGVTSNDEVLTENRNAPLLGGLPLTCASNKSRNTENAIITSKEDKTSSEYFVQGLLTRYWPSNNLESDHKSVFAFVNVLQYVDWINLQIEKLYS